MLRYILLTVWCKKNNLGFKDLTFPTLHGTIFLKWERSSDNLLNSGSLQIYETKITPRSKDKCEDCVQYIVGAQ